eukprot:359185-Chlamydomonas_euryale.AAC.3
MAVHVPPCMSVPFASERGGGAAAAAAAATVVAAIAPPIDFSRSFLPVASRPPSRHPPLKRSPPQSQSHNDPLKWPAHKVAPCPYLWSERRAEAGEICAADERPTARRQSHSPSLPLQHETSEGGRGMCRSTSCRRQSTPAVQPLPLHPPYQAARPRSPLPAL